MMFTTASDNGTHVRKYLATLGVAIAIVSLSGASLFLRDSSLLAFKRDDISQLTPAAQQTIDRRQHYLLFVTMYLPWFVMSGLVAGLLLAIFGLRGWINRQQVTDEREDQDLVKFKYEIRRLTEAELQDKHEREAGEALGAAPDNASQVLYFDIPSDGRRSLDEVDGVGLESFSDRKSRVVDVIQYLEAQVVAKVTASLPSAEVTTSVKVGDYTVDALAVDEASRRGYVFDIKYSEKSFFKNLSNRLTESVRLAAAAVKLSEGYGFSFRPVLLLVVGDQSAVPPQSSVDERLQGIAAAFSVSIKVIIIPFSAIEKLTAADLLEPSAGDPAPEPVGYN